MAQRITYKDRDADVAMTKETWTQEIPIKPDAHPDDSYLLYHVIMTHLSKLFSSKITLGRWWICERAKDPDFTALAVGGGSRGDLSLCVADVGIDS